MNEKLVEKQNFIKLFPNAIEHFSYLIEQEEQPDLGLRISVDKPLSKKAEVNITFCPKTAAEDSDIRLDYEKFLLYVDNDSVEALKDASIDYVSDDMGGELQIKAPNIKGKPPENNAPLKQRVSYLIDSEINPGLKSHGGYAKLVDIIEDSVVLLTMGGGCQGCGMAKVTLKNGIEKTILDEFPEIVEVRDVTNHAAGENPYFTKQQG